MSCPPETERLALRELRESDLDFVASMLADPEVMRYYPRCQTRDEACEWIARQRRRYAEDGHALWLVSEKRGGEPVGQVGLVRQWVDGVPEDEIGYLIARAHWRRGFAFEAAAATRDHSFGALGRRRVISLIRPENLPSRGVARKLGMAVEGSTCCWGLEHLVFALARGSAAPGERP
jgi:RimJ/RimL family protein N-acetyltransferase